MKKQSVNLAPFVRTSAALLALVFLQLASAWAASAEKAIYTFNKTSWPIGGLVADSSGNLYGTTSLGGKYQQGSVFELSQVKGNHWTEKTLYSFTGKNGDGVEPWGGTLVLSNGNLYGTTYYGGTNNWGTVFEVSPSTNGKWTEQIIGNIADTTGFNPKTGVIMDSEGNLYGSTPGGGTYTGGVVFQLAPGAGGKWTFNTYSFTGEKDGAVPNYLTLKNGNPIHLYGGATYNLTQHDGGLIFELTLQNGTWAENTLYDFSGGSDGKGPTGRLTVNKDGNTIYGATVEGGGSNNGTVFELAYSGGTWAETVLYSFTGGSDGSRPWAGPISDSKGNLYGTAAYGGQGSCSQGGGCGAIYELAANTWTETTLWEFTGGADGGEPLDTLLLYKGELYGTTYAGGKSNAGVAFKVKP